VPVVTPGGRTSRPAAAFTAPSWSAQEAEADGRLDSEDVAEPKTSASTSFSINRGNGFEAFGHLDQGFYARNLGSTPVPPKNSYIADEPCVAVWYEHGVSSSSELKALNLELSSGSLFMPFDDALKLSRDPVAYPRARRALCEKLVGLVSSRLNVISTWRQLVSALRNFLSKRSDADSTYYFLSTFLAGEERTEDRAPRRSAFSEFMRALDAHFAPASTSETAELLLERAKSFVLTPSRTLSALLEERLRAVELAGTHSQIGLYEYVRGTFSEVVEDLPRSDVSGLRSMLRQVEVARSNSGGLSDMVFLL